MKISYNYDMTEFPSEEAPGASVFYKNKDGEIFHSYSSFGRGWTLMLGAYNYLDITPKGRDEDNLVFSMSWVRHHDRYDDNYAVDAKQTYVAPGKSESSCCSGRTTNKLHHSSMRRVSTTSHVGACAPTRPDEGVRAYASLPHPSFRLAPFLHSLRAEQPQSIFGIKRIAANRLLPGCAQRNVHTPVIGQHDNP